MTDQDPSAGGPPPTEEELRAAYEAELAQLRVEDVVVQTVVSLLNLGGRKAGLAPGTEGERDLDQVALAIEGCRRLMPLIEAALGPDGSQLKEAISQLQMAYVRLGGSGPVPGGGDPGGPAAPPEPPPAPPKPEGPGGGRLWVPGQ